MGAWSLSPLEMPWIPGPVKRSVCVCTPHAHVFVGVTDHRPAPEKGGTQRLSQEAHSVDGATDHPDSGCV